MTHQRIKQIVATGDFCIQCPSDYATNERWRKYIEYINKSEPKAGAFPDPTSGRFSASTYYSPTPFYNGTNYLRRPESKTVLTLDEWWSVMGDDQPTSYTIQDLAEGRCAVVNDGTAEELNEVLMAAFPKFKKATGDCSWYRSYGIYKWMGYYIPPPTIPTQSVKDFVKQLDKDEHQQWQPQPGEMVEWTNVVDNDDYFDRGKFIGVDDNVYVIKSRGGNYIPARRIRQQQYHTPTIEELKAAYAQVHGVDVELVKPNLS